MLKIVGKLMKLLLPKSCSITQCNPNVARHLYDKAKGKENIHFLKVQREQLQSLRTKILSQKDEVTLKMIKVDKQIQSLESTKTDGIHKF